MRFLVPFARFTPSFDVPAHLGENKLGLAWLNWYFRGVAREGGIIRVIVNDNYLATCGKLLKKEINEQIRYHRDNQEKLETIELRLRKLSLFLFGATFIVCWFHLKEYFPSERAEGALTLFAIVLPAFGAALEGILHQGEFGRMAYRSHAIKSRLEELLKGISDEQMSFRDLGRVAESFCEIQLSEQADWRSVFIRKEVPFP